MKAITIQDIGKYKFLSNLSYSPDGEHVAVTVSNGNLEENSYDKYIYVASTKNFKFKKLTNGGKEGAFIWGDNENLIFPRMTKKSDLEKISKGEELTVFASININGGEAEELFRVPLNVIGIKKAGEMFAFVVRKDLARPNLCGLNEDERAAALGKYQKEQKDFQVADELPFWFNGLGFINKLRKSVYTYNPKNQELLQITEDNFDTAKLEVSKDNDFLVISGLSFEKTNSKNLNGIYKYDLKAKKLKTVVDFGKYAVGNFAITENKIIFAASYWEDDYEFVSPDFYVADVDKENAVEKVLDYDGDLGCQVGSDCRLGGGIGFKTVENQLYFVHTADSKAHIAKMSEYKPTDITDGTITFDSFDINNGKCLAVGMTDVSLQEIYAVDLKTGESQCVSNFNDESLKDNYVAPCKEFSFVNKDGVRIDGWVLEPYGYEKGKKYPGILEIHGGPRGSYGKAFYHEMQVFAGDGCFVFFCNPRGSSSRGNEFANLAGKFGTIDYDDFMEFTDEILKAYPDIDEKNLAVGGGSYGGYMTNWIIGQTDRFKAACSQRGIANWGAFNMVSDIGAYFGKREQQSDLWDRPEKIWGHSPMKYANNAKTPTLFIHSLEDYRCWRPESEQMYRALMDNKIPARICFFKGENHELSRSGKPKHRVRRLTEITAWFYNYIKG